MQCGSILDAPNGHGPLRADTDYVFLASREERVLLAQLGTPNPKGELKPGAHLIALFRDDFEDALDEGALLDTGETITLPPWLNAVSEDNLELRDARRPRAKILHKDRIETRLLTIAEAISNPRTWMFAEDPEYALNRMAREVGCNETRYRTWAITYVACSRNVWSLHSPWHNIGRWMRKLHGGKKFGRPSLAYGTRYGNGEDPELTEAYFAGYEEHARLGRTLQEVYDLIMVKNLKCKVGSRGKQKFKVFIPPAGQGFYTYDQFRYRLIKRFGLEQIQMDLYGEIRVRTKMAPSKGKYAEHLVNLMEEVEADAFSCAELPRGYLEGSTLPPLKVAVGIDVLSSMGLGIGFSLGSERREAYRMMLFCMAVPKVYFCALFGLKIRPEEWPSQGLPSCYITDRGPGAALKLMEEFDDEFPIRELALAYSGQSKATVESSNPRKRKIEGKPGYLKSKFTPVKLVRKLIWEFIKRNRTRWIEDKIEAIPEMAFVSPDPLSFWNSYDARGRNDAQLMSVDDAVRAFLTPKKFSLEEDGVYLLGRKFNSTALKESGIFQKLKRSPLAVMEVDGYVMDLCVRHIWVELDGQLYQLEAQLKVGGDTGDLYVSLSELEQFAEARAKVNSAFRQHRRAASAEGIIRFEEDTGDDWDSIQRETGRPKKSPLAKQEEKEAKQQGSRGRTR
jgi:hypothetical protein